MARLWRVLRQPKVTVPILLAGGLLAAAVSLSNLSDVLQRIGRIPAVSLLYTVVLAAAYLALKGLQFRGFLRELNIFAGWRSLLIAYAVGELALTLPLGIYSQNYVLQRIQGGDMYRTAAATTLMLAFEAGLLFLLLAVLGVPGWPWLRPLALASLLGLVVFVLVMARWKKLREWADRLSGRLGLSVPAPVKFLRGLGALTDSRVLVRRGYLTVLYVAVLIVAFRNVAHGVGVPELGVAQAAVIYAFSLSVALVFGGITSQVGVMEIAGMGAAQASGYSYSEGLAMLLGFRLVWMACIWLLGLPVVFWLRTELQESDRDHIEETSD